MPGVDADDLTAQSFRELLQRFERSCPHSLAPDGAMLYHIRLPSGKERYLRIETTHEDGTQVGLAEDATANTLEKLRIEHECDYDTLTDLYNRRATASAPSSSAHPKNSATRRFCCSTSTTSSR